MKYVINSSGEAVALDEGQKEIRFIPEDTRLNELREFKDKLMDEFRKGGIDTEDKAVWYMLQPNYTNERLVFLVRTALSGSSEAVKKANEFRKSKSIADHPDLVKDRKMRDFVSSIYQYNFDEMRREWYCLSAGYIEFERNLYDCRKIDVRYKEPMFYQEFLREMETVMNENSETTLCRRYNIISARKEVPITTEDETPAVQIRTAFEDEVAVKSGNKSRLDVIIKNFLIKYKAENGYQNRDSISNIATRCLLAINNNRRINIFRIYEEFKVFVKKTLGSDYGVSYNGSSIIVKNGDREFRAYVTYASDTEPPQFIIGGRIITGMDKLRKALSEEDLFVTEQWFAEKVEPNIIPITALPARRRTPPRDEIGWTTSKKEG